MTPAATSAEPGPASTSSGDTWTVRRWSTASRWAIGPIGLLLLGLALLPTFASLNVVQKVTSLLTLVILAVMWNALAGYGGLVSVGQQAFIGLGAYGTIYLTQRGMPAYLAVVVAALACGAVAAPTAWLLLRFGGGQFAIATWVVAEVFALLLVLDTALGGGTGISLTALRGYGPRRRQIDTYLLALVITIVLLGAVVALLRSSLGAGLQAIRDDQGAAASCGVRVTKAKRILFVLAAVGCGAAGALILASTLFIQPHSIFGVQWSAYMIFMVLVGGLGTFEGPILGAVALFFIQNRFGNDGAWYLVGLGVTAIVFALFLPSGLWGAVQQRLRLQLLPLGHEVTRDAAASETVE
jgi:branched-chain amino acid transport system permease protein